MMVKVRRDSLFRIWHSIPCSASDHAISIEPRSQHCREWELSSARSIGRLGDNPPAQRKTEWSTEGQRPHRERGSSGQQAPDTERTVLVSRVATDDDAVPIDDDRLAESELADRCGHNIDGVVFKRGLISYGLISVMGRCAIFMVCILAIGGSWPVAGKAALRNGAATLARVGEGAESGRSIRPDGPVATGANVVTRVASDQRLPAWPKRTGRAKESLFATGAVPAAIVRRDCPEVPNRSGPAYRQTVSSVLSCVSSVMDHFSPVDASTVAMIPLRTTVGRSFHASMTRRKPGSSATRLTSKSPSAQGTAPGAALRLRIVTTPFPAVSCTLCFPAKVPMGSIASALPVRSAAAASTRTIPRDARTSAPASRRI